MHFVTKVLVVFATILSVFLSALVISYAVNSDRVASDYSTLQATLASIHEVVDGAVEASGSPERCVEATRGST